MKRRTFLKVIGCTISAPSLIVKENKLVGPLVDDEIVSTGFHYLDVALRGGFRKKFIHAIQSTASQLIPSNGFHFAELLAREMGRKNSVALFTDSYGRSSAQSSYDGNVFVYPYHTIPDYFKAFTYVATHHDVVILFHALPPHPFVASIQEITRNSEAAVVHVLFNPTRPLERDLHCKDSNILLAGCGAVLHVERWVSPVGGAPSLSFEIRLLKNRWGMTNSLLGMPLFVGRDLFSNYLTYRSYK